MLRNSLKWAHSHIPDYIFFIELKCSIIERKKKILKFFEQLNKFLRNPLVTSEIRNSTLWLEIGLKEPTKRTSASVKLL